MTINQKIAKNYILFAINWNLQEVKYVGNYNILKDIKNIYLDLKIVYNIDKNFKKANLDI